MLKKITVFFGSGLILGTIWYCFKDDHKLFLASSLLLGALYWALVDTLLEGNWNVVGRGSTKTWVAAFVAVMLAALCEVLAKMSKPVADSKHESLAFVLFVGGFAAASQSKRLFVWLKQNWGGLLFLSVVILGGYMLWRGIMYWPEPGRP